MELFTKTEDEKELENLLKSRKVQLEQNLQDSSESIADSMRVIISAKGFAKSNQFDSNELIWNAAGFINLSSWDLKVIGQEVFLSTNEWKKRYFIRQAYHLIYELLNDIFEVLGNEFKKKIDDLSDPHIQNSLKIVKANLNEFKQAYFAKLKHVRNFTSAHRDHNITEQIEVIKSLDWIESISIISKFDELLNELGQIMQRVVDLTVDNLDRKSW